MTNKTPAADKLLADTKAMFEYVANYGGGPAYPQQMQWGSTDGIPNTWFAVGLTKREQIAAMLLNGMLAYGMVLSDEDMADRAVKRADVLLERLKK